MLKHHKPLEIAPPFSAYSHGVEVGAGARWLHVSGQVGITPEGEIPADLEAQTEQAWRNVLAVLAAAGMGPHDLVKVTGLVTRQEAVPLYRVVRDRLLEGAEPASTVAIVAGLAHPDWVVEIEAVAAKAD